MVIEWRILTEMDRREEEAEISKRDLEGRRNLRNELWGVLNFTVLLSHRQIIQSIK